MEIFLSHSGSTDVSINVIIISSNFISSNLVYSRPSDCFEGTKIKVILNTVITNKKTS